MTPQIDQRVLDREVADSGDLFHRLRHDAFRGRARRLPRGPQPHRFRERGTIHLPAHGEGQGGQDGHRGGHHVIGKFPGQCGPQSARIHGGTGQGRDVEQQLVGLRTASRGDDRPFDPGKPQGRGLDLAGFDAETAYLDLVIGASEVMDLTRLIDAHPITGAVHPLAGNQRIGDETAGREPVLPGVATRETGPGHVEFAVRGRGQGLVEDVGAHPLDRMAYGNAVTGRVEVVGVQACDRGLRRAVGVDHAPPVACPFPHQGRWTRLGPDEKAFETVGTRRAGTGENRRRNQRMRDAPIRHLIGQGLPTQSIRTGQHERRRRPPRADDVLHTRVK